MKDTSSYIISALFLILIGFSSCEKRTYQSIEELDNENINAYISSNNLTVTRYKNTDLYYEIIRPGTGRPLAFDEVYPMTFSLKSLDGTYQADDTLSAGNRYYDYLGYFPFTSAAAGGQNSPVERQDDLKYVVRDILQNSDGEIRILVPSRLTGWGRQGNRDLGIPPNASMDYTIHVIDDLEKYEDEVIKTAIAKAGFNLDEFEQTENHIYYKIIEQGAGASLTELDQIQAKYTLRNTSGTVIESSDSTRFALNSVIDAWSKVIPKVNAGGKLRIFTPSSSAYGTSGTSTMPPFMSLDFEVEVLKKY